MSDLEFRKLDDEDAHLYRALRLEALKESPDAFLATYEEDAEKTEADFVLRLNNDYAVGCFQDDHLIASADFYVAEPGRSKLAHKGTVAGFYVRPRYRSTDAAEKLMDELIAHLPDDITQLNLSTIAGDDRSLAFYEKVGFQVWGTEPRGSRQNGVYRDEIHMVRFIDDA